MGKKEIHILIVGAGRAGCALIGMFKDDPSVKIAGIVDKDDKAPGLKLAAKLKIPTADTWKELITSSPLDEVINATGSDEVHEELLKSKPQSVVMVSGVMAKTLWFLAKEYEIVERKIKEAQEDVEAHEWGVAKTNEAIKLLYKELEEKNKELQDLDRLKSDFISTVSHELRTPLAITKEGITLIQDGILGEINEKQEKVLVTARDSIDRLARLITSLLDISRIEAGNIEIKKSMISVTKVAEQVASFFETKAADKGLELRVNVPEAGVDAYADNDRIIQVFTNLVGNALKFTDAGSIEISVEEKEDEIECSVADTGKGVTEEDIPKMFVKFQQIGRVHGDGERGTGLGLSIARSIIEMHEGKIWVESEIDKGTKFIFTLPKYAEDVLLKEYIDGGIAEAKKNNGKMSLMIVSIANFDKAKELVSEENIYSALRGVENVLKESFNHSGGAALKDSHECIVILPNSSKQDVLSAEGRLKQAVDDYLVREKLADKIKLKFRCVTYPDEASDAEELIKAIMGK
ncbi:MAG: diguanylate cyclase [Candidatus Omnitrophica bacterium]|nr:diguanylate cyclase [Candidatus Omnitrophota bacterium]